MTEITASMVKNLREKTGAGMMDCKKALQETDADMEEAIRWLRKKGVAQAEKKAGRTAAEGLVAVTATEKKAVIIEINAETDFVARNADFQKMTRDIAQCALNNDADINRLGALKLAEHNLSVDQYIAEMVGVIGENMKLRRARALHVEKGVIASYVHGQVAEGMGKIAVLVALESDADKDPLSAFAKQIAMHIAATAPLSLHQDDLDPAIVKKEYDILHAQALEDVRKSGKPEHLADKMVEGRMRKFYQESILMQQIFVINEEKETVDQALQNQAQKLGQPIKITGFIRFGLGEGIEKEISDFAQEVAAAAGA